MSGDTEPEPLRARVPADVEAPDRVLYGLTARQLAIVAVAAAVAYAAFRGLHQQLPMPLLLGGLVPLAAAAVMLALGRRDGLPLDVWLLAAIRFHRAPTRLVPAAGTVPKPPGWAPAAGKPPPAPAPLRLPAHAITDGGLVELGHHQAAAVVAATTVNLALRTPGEQAALISAYARWLNSLEQPVQVVVAAQPVDLASHAQRLAQAAPMLPHPALAEAACDYANFLAELETEREPLWRTATITHTAAGARRHSDATRAAEHTAAALPALGVATRVLDGPTLAEVLSAAADPYTYAASHPHRALPETPVTTTGSQP